MFVLDASALLAYLQAEPGAGVVAQALRDGAACSAANWSETMQKAFQLGRDWNAARQLFESFDLMVEPVIQEDAEWAAIYWQNHSSLSLGDRLCLALAHRLSATVLTADAAWGRDGNIEQIR